MVSLAGGRLSLCLLACPLFAWVGVAPTMGQEVLQNGDFEAWRPVQPGADGLVAGWSVPGREAPVGWHLNNAYPGTLEQGAGDGHGGGRYVRIVTSAGRTAHLYQPCEGLVAGQWYELRAWVRGGPVVIGCYEYYQSGPIRGQQIGARTTSTTKWTELRGYYRPAGEGYVRSALALQVPPETTAEFDDVSLVHVDLGPGGEGDEVVIENEAARLVFSSDGRLRGLFDRAGGENYAAEPTPWPPFVAHRGGFALPAAQITADAEGLVVRFPDPEVRLRWRVTSGPRHILFELTDAAPEDLEQVEIDLPVRRLATVGAAFGATYDERFGMALFCASVNARNVPVARSADVFSLRGACYRRRGLVGARFALVAAPAGQFKEGVIEAERAADLPCVWLEGRWARDSRPARLSYLFGTGVKEEDIDTLIEYAKVGGFGTIIFLKNDWLANHGHFDINLANFPGGIDGLRAAVAKIHAAGLQAGVHVFGPSISPNDPYVTPVPDERLAFAPGPALAAAVDEKVTEIPLTGRPQLPPLTPESRAFPGRYLRIGDEIVRYGEIAENPWRLTGCTRGALGTTAAAHPAATATRLLLNLWGFFLVDPDSTLADELTANFARVFNAAGFDFVYFDASDGIHDAYLDRWYYLNKLHLGFYRAIGRDVLYQTSNGTGSDLCWHIVPRSASADGHGDIKGYLDERWPGILGMAANWTLPDIGWYYWFRDVRPDQLEYVCAKAMGVNGSISLETSRAALETLTQSRQMMETVGRWERCRATGGFDETIRARLREPKRDFKLFELDGRWRLYRAEYEPPRAIDALDGEANVWILNNPLPEPCPLGVEIVRGRRLIARDAYERDDAETIEPFDEAEIWRPSETNAFEPFVVGADKVMTPTGPVRAGVTQRVTVSETAKVGARCLVYEATNEGAPNGWGGIGRRFEPVRNLAAHAAVGFWLWGDGGGEAVRLQFRDTAGRPADWLIPIDYHGWRLHTLPLPAAEQFDRTRVEYLLLYFNNVPAKAAVRVMADDLKALPALSEPAPLGGLALRIGDRAVALPVELGRGQALTCEGPGGQTLWPGGMQPGVRFDLPAELLLSPGENRVELTAPEPFPGDLTVLLYRLWAMEP